MTAGSLDVRDATPADGAACASIYAPYVTDTAITFEIEPPSAEEMAGRITAARASHSWLVCSDGASVIGYAYAAPYKSRAAYRWSCEVSVYVDRSRRRSGAGRALYEALFARLEPLGYRMAVAAMTLPNEASEGLHRATGFTAAGVLERIGFKHGAWHDVAWMQRAIGPLDEPPADPARGTPERRLLP